MKTIEGFVFYDLAKPEDLRAVSNADPGSIYITESPDLDDGAFCFDVDIAFGGKQGKFAELKKALLFAHALKAKLEED